MIHIFYCSNYYHTHFYEIINSFKGSNNAPSKAALKSKKKREAKKAKQNEEDGEKKESSTPIVSSVKITLSGDPEVDKKLKNIKKVSVLRKLLQILHSTGFLFLF